MQALREWHAEQGAIALRIAKITGKDDLVPILRRTHYCCERASSFLYWFVGLSVLDEVGADDSS